MLENLTKSAEVIRDVIPLKDCLDVVVDNERVAVLRIKNDTQMDDLRALATGVLCGDENWILIRKLSNEAQYGTDDEIDILEETDETDIVFELEIMTNKGKRIMGFATKYSFEHANGKESTDYALSILRCAADDFGINLYYDGPQYYTRCK